jgi:hypothetical protein
MFKFCWHKWGKWSRVIQDYEGSLHQMCECQKCGVIKRKRAASWMMGSLSADQVNDAIEAKLKQQNGYAEEKNA